MNSGSNQNYNKWPLNAYQAAEEVRHPAQREERRAVRGPHEVGGDVKRQGGPEQQRAANHDVRLCPLEFVVQLEDVLQQNGGGSISIFWKRELCTKPLTSKTDPESGQVRFAPA